MKYSIKFLMFATGIVAISMLASQLPPRCSEDWSGGGTTAWNYNTESQVTFFTGGCSANNDHFVGYLQRHDNPEAENTAGQWFKQVDGYVYVLGKRVMPQSQYQLFVSNNHSEPELWTLTRNQAKSFRQMDANELEHLWQGRPEGKPKQP